MLYQGSCHCNAVGFEVEAPDDLEVEECNCSICRRSGFLHLIVPASRFRLIRGKEDLTSYRFGTRSAEHLFCRICGIKAFYIPRSNPDGVDVNSRCLEPEPHSVSINAFDGVNWERHASRLRHLSQS